MWLSARSSQANAAWRCSSVAKTIYGEIGENVNLVSPGRAALMKFSAYLVADMLWVTLPRGTRCKVNRTSNDLFQIEVIDGPELGTVGWMHMDKLDDE